MSFIRAATVARSAVAASRRYSTEAATKKSSNLPFYLGGAGIGGLLGYLYLESTHKPTKKVQEKSPLDPENFIDFKLKKIIPYNHNTSTFVFELPNNEASLMPIASCVVVKSSDPEALKDKNGKPVIRPYTPISQPDTEGELAFLVKKYDNGVASKYIHELKPGETLSIKGPISKFPYKVNEFDEVALIGGGSGITPLYQVLTYALRDPSNKTKFKLIFANQTEADILLREEFDELKRKHPDNFDIFYAVDKSGPNWNGHTGYLTAEVLKQQIAPPSLNEKVKVFVCGPPGQVLAIAGKKKKWEESGRVEWYLEGTGMDKSNTHKSGNKSATSSTNRDATNKSISPTTFYGTQSQNPPPLPSRPTAVGSSTTSYYFSSAPSQSKDSSPFREPELVSEDDHMPALASEQDTIPRPFQTYEQTPSTMDTSTDWTESARAGWGEEPANHWSRPVNDNNWETYGGVGSYASVLTADKINIDGRDEDEENDWWNVAVREKHRRPGSGILPPLLADKLHNPLHSLFSVSVSPPDIKIPSFLPSTPSSSSSSPPIASGSSAAPPPFIQPTAEEVRTAVPHPNAYYCTRHNGWVIILWKSSSFFPPLARSFLKNNTVPLLDQARRRKTGSCIGEGEHQRGQANRTHHLHVYERAVDARQLTPAFRRSEWESAMLEKRRRRKVTLHLDELDKDALEKAIEKGEPMEEDEEEEDH
ncbi:hypothetical protein EW146_g8349, partial [Bondarzewia mesenterica]